MSEREPWFPSRLTPAQRRVLDYLRADTSGDFVVVPSHIGNDVRTFDTLAALGLIEQKWQPAPLPPGSFEMVYRAANSQGGES